MYSAYKLLNPSSVCVIVERNRFLVIRHACKLSSFLPRKTLASVLRRIADRIVIPDILVSETNQSVCMLCVVKVHLFICKFCLLLQKNRPKFPRSGLELLIA